MRQIRIVIRPATHADVPRMVELSALKRKQYAVYSPVFWRPAPDADAAQQKFFTTQLGDAANICLVHEAGGPIDGFLIARVVAAPPVYDTGGKVCMIDDFMVSDPTLWPSVGIALRDEA